jgi:hypothetical protein
VSKKEGKCSVKVSDLCNFWNGQKNIKLLDPNMLASKDRIDLLQQLGDSKAWVDFTQGLDIRMVDDAVIEKLKQIKIKMIHFAWDRIEDEAGICKKLEYFKAQTGIPDRKARVYVLTNHGTTHEQD